MFSKLQSEVAVMGAKGATAVLHSALKPEEQAKKVQSH